LKEMVAMEGMVEGVGKALEVVAVVALVGRVVQMDQAAVPRVDRQQAREAR
jgi:heme exporter protein D